MVSQDSFVQVLRIQTDADFAGWFVMVHAAVYPCRGFAYLHWRDDSLPFHLRQFLFDLLLHFERDSPWWVYDWRYCGVDGDVVLSVELPDALKTLRVLPDQVGGVLDARQFFGDFAIEGDDSEFLQ